MWEWKCQFRSVCSSYVCALHYTLVQNAACSLDSSFSGTLCILMPPPPEMAEPYFGKFLIFNLALKWLSLPWSLLHQLGTPIPWQNNPKEHEFQIFLPSILHLFLCYWPSTTKNSWSHFVFTLSNSETEVTPCCFPVAKLIKACYFKLPL